MVIITPRAAVQIRSSSQQQAPSGEVHLRLAARLDDKGTIEYGMGFDEISEGDMQVASSGINILVSAGSVELLTGATLDYVEINPGEQRFIFVNPNDPSHKAPKPGD